MRLTIGQTVQPASWPRMMQTEPAEISQIELGPAVPGAAQQLAGHEAEQHRRHRRDEIQRLVAAGVVLERLAGVGGQEVEQPAVEVGRGVGVHLPVGEEAGQVAARLRQADGSVIEIGRRQREQGEPEPVADKDGRHSRQLHADAAAAQQVDEEIAEADLRQHVDEQVAGRLRPVGGEEYSQKNEHGRADGDVKEDFAVGVALVFSTGVGVGNGDAGHEHERRLNKVPEAAADPGDVVGVERQDVPDGVAGEAAGDLPQLEAGRGHRQHDEAAVGVQRGQAGRLFPRSGDRDRLRRGGRRFGQQGGHGRHPEGRAISTTRRAGGFIPPGRSYGASPTRRDGQ